MKKKVGILISVLGVVVILSGSVALGSMVNHKGIRQQKLQKIEVDGDKIKEQEKELQEAKTDAEYRKVETELKKNLKEKAQLEVETGTYDYQGYFNDKLFSVYDCYTILESSLDKASEEWADNKVKELKAIYKKYSVYKDSTEDYLELSKQLGKEVDEVNAKYAKYEN